MPRYMTDLIIENGDGSGTNVVTSAEIDFSLSYGYCVQFVFSGGTPTGSAVVEGSINGLAWTPISTIAVTTVGSVFDNKDAIYWPKLRLKYTGTAGTGVVVNAFLSTKGG